MAKELFISTTPHETKVAVVEDEQLAEIYFERENEYTLAGSIYKGRVTRVLPGMQSAFVDIGLERDAFLYVTDFLEEQEDQEEFEQVINRAHSDAQQAPTQQPRSTEVAAETPNTEPQASTGEQETEGAPQPFERTPRRWRGRRGRRRGRFQDQTGTQPVQTGEAAQSDRDEGPENEPLVLPGESLSKYRQPEAAEEPLATKTTETAPSEPQNRIQPSTRVTEPSSEPRGPHFSTAAGEPLTVLPGESISKYRAPGAEPTGEAQQQAARSERFQGRGQSRWERPTRRPERDPHAEAAPAESPVVRLPGESLAKYRGAETETPDQAAASDEAAVLARTEVPEANASAEVHAPAEAEKAGSVPMPSIGWSATEPVRYAPEQSDADERIEHALQSSESATEASRVESQSGTHDQRNDSSPAGTLEDVEQGESSGTHEFGSGVLEEEVIEEEEADAPILGEHLEEDFYDDLEEETLDADNAEQLVEAVREAHVNQRLGLQQGEPPDSEDHPAGEETESFVPQNGQQHPEQIEVGADVEDAAFQEEAEGAGEGEESHEEFAAEGRAELRAPANTAAFQQRTQPTDRAPDRFRRGRRGRPMRGRRNIQRESQPTISELLKEGQEILVQIAKEPIAKKGARITSHIALPGRFLVFMPTVNHVGVSRKIGSDEERQRLKRILISEKGSAHGGFIVRTAAAGASEEDLRSDLRFLINLWTDIKTRSENSKAPALIYHDLNLVERILRDQVTSNFAGMWVDSPEEYERIVRFLGRFQPAMVRRAKLYTKDTPLFEQFGIQEEINNALKSKVWLKSGGYIVINQTEALVAIDINTGKYVGKTQRLEDTIVKTNIDAIREIVRQIRLRDLGGIIVIDFIDMDERRNRQKVMQALEEALKNDRAPSKVLQFNDFGLVAITRKRVKQSLERTLSTACTYCTGTGMIKSVQTVCNEIYVEMRKMAHNLERHDVMLRVNPEVVKALKANNARWLQEMEELTGKTIIVKSDPLLHQEQFDIN